MEKMSQSKSSSSMRWPSGRMSRLLGCYAREIRWIATRPPTLAASVALFRHTLNHHIGNWIGSRPTVDRVMLSTGLGRPVILRPGAGDLAVFYEVFAERAYEVDEQDLPSQSVHLIVDCGAHIGFSALYFASRYPNARIAAIEPSPDNYDLLVKNTAHESRIQRLCACVGESDGRRCLDTSGPAWSHHLAEIGVPVDCLSLVSLRRALGQPIDLLKVDVEGAEVGLLKDHGARAIVAELHGGYTPHEFARDVQPLKVKRSRRRVDTFQAIDAGP